MMLRMLGFLGRITDFWGTNQSLFRGYVEGWQTHTTIGQTFLTSFNRYGWRLSPCKIWMLVHCFSSEKEGIIERKSWVGNRQNYKNSSKHFKPRAQNECGVWNTALQAWLARYRWLGLRNPMQQIVTSYPMHTYYLNTSHQKPSMVLSLLLRTATSTVLKSILITVSRQVADQRSIPVIWKVPQATIHTVPLDFTLW